MEYKLSSISQTRKTWIEFHETGDRLAESAEQDQTAHTCSLILLYTLREISLWQRTAG